jgi:AAA15 family ATPase/GTPase
LTIQYTHGIIFKNDLRIENDKTYYFPIFEHDTNASKNTLTYFEQSSGTQELFSILPYYEFVLRTGGVLALDEFDVNLHPHILPLLLELFDNKESNPLNAQMIFTTHHERIIDSMGKYRTVLVNKEKCESFAYRLDEIPGDILRNDRAISPIYNSGKIGGVPRVIV